MHASGAGIAWVEQLPGKLGVPGRLALAEPPPRRCPFGTDKVEMGESRLARGSYLILGSRKVERREALSTADF
jgi:hypothetical protein